ncbi:hypothetical protein WJ70_02625 [Burkholderia ubonensis]|nr:hypothetical protein WJ70_02625 [Burkholderia ubonensis]
MHRAEVISIEGESYRPFVVPDDWTPEQALVVFELLDDLLATITDFYGVQLHEQLSELCASRDIHTRKHDPPF